MTNLNLSAANKVAFGSTRLSVIERDNQVWLTAADLARALGYKSTDGVTRIYNRNKSEFTSELTALVSLQPNEINEQVNLTVSKNLEIKTRVFSASGCRLIAIFSRTKLAEDFRRWVLQVLENLPQQFATPKQVLPSYLQNNHGRTLFKDAVTSSAYSMLVRGNFEEEQRYMSEQVNKRVASRMEDIACHEYEGLRLLMESDGIGGFDTKQIMPGIHLLENKDLAAHILSAKGPLSRYLPAIMQACAQRMQEVCDLPLAGVDIEGLNL